MSKEIFYTGSWERHGRSLTAAASISLIGIGVFYFYFQSFATAITLGIVQGFVNTNHSSGDEAGKFSNASIAALRIVVFATQYACMFFPSWFLVRRMHTMRFTDYVRLKKFTATETLLAVIGAITLMPISIFFSTFLMESLHIPEKLLRSNDSLFTSYTPVEFASLIFGVAITPAVCEELFFRGHVQRTFERTLSFHSIWIVGIVFGLFHFQPIGLASLSLLGLYFGYLFYRSKSLYPSMAAHFTNNTLALLFSYQPFMKDQEWVVSATSSDIGAVAAGSIPFAAGTIFLFHKKTKLNKAAEEIIEENQEETLSLDELITRSIPKDQDNTSEEVIPAETLFSTSKNNFVKDTLVQIRKRNDTLSNRHWKRLRMIRNR